MARLRKAVQHYAVLGEPVAEAVIFAIDTDRHIVICDLLDPAGRVLAVNRYFSPDAPDCPFAPLTPGERDLIDPTDTNGRARL